jgi:hypothetical protein
LFSVLDRVQGRDPNVIWKKEEEKEEKEEKEERERECGFGLVSLSLAVAPSTVYCWFSASPRHCWLSASLSPTHGTSTHHHST